MHSATIKKIHKPILMKLCYNVILLEAFKLCFSNFVNVMNMQIMRGISTRVFQCKVLKFSVIHFKNIC